jgi:hypothetical protein
VLPDVLKAMHDAFNSQTAQLSRISQKLWHVAHAGRSDFKEKSYASLPPDTLL